MNRSSSSNFWQARQRLFARLRLFFRRAAAWLWNYFALTRPLAWPPDMRYSGPGPAWRGQNVPPGGNARAGNSYFYLGILAGCFTAYFFLGGQLSAAIPTPPSSGFTAADGQSLAGIALALLLYPAVHRLGRFDDLHTISGSLLTSAMFGFVVSVLARVIFR